MCVEIILIICHLSATVLIALLKYFHKNVSDCYNQQGITFLKLKLISMYTFGACYFLHCVLYIWKHVVQSNGQKAIGVASYLITSLNICILFIYFDVSIERKYLYTFRNTCLSLGAILFMNIGSVSNALSSGFLFVTHMDNNTANNYIVSRNTSISSDVTRLMKALEITEPLLSSAIVGYSLLTMDLLCPNACDHDALPNSDNQMQTNGSRVTDHNYSNNQNIELCGILFQLAVFLASVWLFAITFTGLLTGYTVADLKVYVTSHIIMKSFIFIIFIIIIDVGTKYKFCEESIPISSNSRIRYHFNIWIFILIFAFIGNFCYHVRCLTRTAHLQDTKVKDYVIFDNTISIIIGISQTLFILRTYFGKKFENSIDLSERRECVKWLYNDGLYFACSLLAMINMGLWISDSIGNDRLIYKPDGNLFYKISLLLTTFFRFQIGLEFLKLYWCNGTIKSNSIELHQR